MNILFKLNFIKEYLSLESISWLQPVESRLGVCVWGMWAVKRVDLIIAEIISLSTSLSLYLSTSPFLYLSISLSLSLSTPLFLSISLSISHYLYLAPSFFSLSLSLYLSFSQCLFMTLFFKKLKLHLATTNPSLDARIKGTILQLIDN